MSDPKRILVVEDDRELVLGMCIRLCAAGYEVVTASDGLAGLAATIEHRPDLIILDVRLPLMNGLEVLSRLHAQTNTRSIPVVVVSANVVEQTSLSALDLGARCFLAKPFQTGSLIAAVDSVLNNSRKPALTHVFRET